MEKLFPELPEDLKSLSDEDVAQLLADHESASELVLADDPEFLKDMTANEVIDQFKVGVEQIKQLRAESGERVTAFEEYKAEKERLAAEIAPQADEDSGDETDSGDEEEEGSEKIVAEEEVVEEEEKVLVTASAETATASNTGLATTSEAPVVRFSRRAPAPAPARVPVPNEDPQVGTSLVAAGEMSLQYRDPLDEMSLATLVRDSAIHHGPHPKIDAPGKYRFGGPEHKIARADFDFPEERTLNGDVEEATEKIRAVIPTTSQFLGRPGDFGGEALVASGGLCAPLTPIYSMPNFATDAEPVWDSLPVFRAARGGVNTPEATVIGDIESAISSISEADDALGGTFATKSCQDLTCPPYTEVAVQILAHCREYGNLNARAWPEKIAHENALTMAALSRTSEMFMLERINPGKGWWWAAPPEQRSVQLVYPGVHRECPRRA